MSVSSTDKAIQQDIFMYVPFQTTLAESINLRRKARVCRNEYCWRDDLYYFRYKN